MGVFGAFNYGLHLFGGHLGGRFLSYRKLFVGSMALQVIGCACIATGTLPVRVVPHHTIIFSIP
jgi:proton-dependent oligopeptide transporter, POT family